MSNWYELEISVREHCEDLLRRGEEERLARMVALEQRRQRKSLVQALAWLAGWAAISVARAQGLPRLA